MIYLKILKTLDDYFKICKNRNDILYLAVPIKIFFKHGNY